MVSLPRSRSAAGVNAGKPPSLKEVQSDLTVETACRVSFSASLSRPFFPLPKPAGCFPRQAVSQLPRHHYQLAAMMRLVGHKVAEKVHQVRGKVLPRRRRHRPTTSHTEPDQFNHATAAAFERA